MRIFYLAALALLLSTPAVAQNHLEPEDSALAGNESSPEYHAMVAAVLHEAYDFHVEARMVVIPSFEPEFAVGIRHEKDSYRVFVLRSAVHLWRYQIINDMKAQNLTDAGSRKELTDLQEGMPAKPEDVALKRCYADLDSGLSRKIIAVWQEMAVGAHYDKPVDTGEEIVGDDGVTFHFYARRYAGQAWNPLKDSNPGLLVQIGEALVAVCEKKDKASLSILNQLTDHLAERLH